MDQEIRVAHSREEYDKLQHALSAEMEKARLESLMQTPISDREEHAMAEEKAAASQKKPPEESKESKVVPVDPGQKEAKGLGGEPEFVKALLEHLNSSRMTAGQLELLLEKLELQFDQLVHGTLVGQLKQTDNYVFAKEYLDMEIQPLKAVMERMKRMVSMLQDKQITLADDLSQMRQAIGDDMTALKKELEEQIQEAKKETQAGIGRQGKTVNAKVDHEIQRLNQSVEDQLKGFKADFSDRIKSSQKEGEKEIKALKAKLEADGEKLKEEVKEEIKESRKSLESELRKSAQKSDEARQKIQDSLRILGEYMTLIIEAADLGQKIEKLSYDKSLEDMKAIQL